MTILSCSVSECDRTRYGRLEVCNMHYKRYRRNGTYETVRKKNTCSVEDCPRYVFGLSFCSLHYQRYKKHGSTDPQPSGRKACVIDGCGKPRIGRGWCSTHYHRWKRTGDPEYRLAGEVRGGRKICPRCNVDALLDEFYALDSTYCAQCSRDRQREWVAVNPRLKPRLKHQCFTCGAAFIGEKRNWVYCTTECRDLGKNRRNYPHYQRRRARMSLVPAEVFHRDEILDRDDWVCQICGTQIDKNAKFPSPQSASIDHIIPVALGGPHTRRNVQSAHLGCNSAKGANM